MSTLGTAYVQIAPSAQGISGSITNLLDPEAEAAGTSAGTKIGAFAKKALVAAGVGAAFVKLVRSSMAEGGKLQQSYIGGLETIYGTAAESARNYAKEAAKAGISMNSYSEQAVSFGAALKKAYGGDAKKAVEAANTAILDMADNSAKMGTDMTMVQNAYQGFAKQNYTMLDNLKLGYGGTKTEMQRLLKDAEALSGKKYDLSNLGDVYEAIHVIQGELGLTGVAAAEAEGTFTGSFASMKAAAQNFLGELALGMDITDSLQVLVTSANTFFFNNLMPMLGNILRALPGAIATFIQQGVPALLSSLTTLVSTIASAIGDAAKNFTAEQVAAWASNTLPKILSSADKTMSIFIEGLLRNLGKVVAAVGKIGLAVITALGRAIWSRVTAAANGIKERFLAPINALRDKVKSIIEKIKGFFNFKVKTPHIPKPTFSISPAGWKVGDLLKGSIPHLSIKWAAKGGLVDGATLVGAGEAGAEAIVPLDPFWRKMDQLVDTVNNPGNVTINVYASPTQSVQSIAQEVKRIIITETNRGRLAWQ